MRIRTIKPEFYTHEALFELEQETGLPIRIAFTGLWCASDREGRFKWEPRRLGIQILPYDGVDFSRVLDALLTRGFVVKYESGTGVFGWIPSFLKHQAINVRERPSELPNPLECNTIDASATREARVNDPCSVEGKGKEGNMEGKGKEENGKARKRPAPAASSIDLNDDEEEGNEPSPEGLAFADWFRSTLDPGAKPASKWREQWAKAFDDMIRLDKRTPEEIRRVSQWARSDSFWSGNFLSPLKLRKTNKDKAQYFDVFAAGMRKAKPTPPPVVHYREKPTIIDANDPELIRRMEEAEANGEIDEVPF